MWSRLKIALMTSLSGNRFELDVQIQLIPSTVAAFFINTIINPFTLLLCWSCNSIGYRNGMYKNCFSTCTKTFIGRIQFIGKIHWKLSSFFFIKAKKSFSSSFAKLIEFAFSFFILCVQLQFVYFISPANILANEEQSSNYTTLSSPAVSKLLMFLVDFRLGKGKHKKSVDELCVCLYFSSLFLPFKLHVFLPPDFSLAYLGPWLDASQREFIFRSRFKIFTMNELCVGIDGNKFSTELNFSLYRRPKRITGKFFFG